MSFIHLLSSASDVTGGGFEVVPPTVPTEGGGSMWETIGDGVTQFTTGVLTPVTTVVSSNPIALAFLSVTFVLAGVRVLKRVINAFGRGR